MSVSIMSREPGIQCVSTGAVVKAFFSMLKSDRGNNGDEDLQSSHTGGRGCDPGSHITPLL